MNDISPESLKILFPDTSREVSIPSPKVEKTDAKGFTEVLKESISEINHLQVEADNAVKDLASGKSDDIHNTLIALQKANLSFKVTVSLSWFRGVESGVEKLL